MTNCHTFRLKTFKKCYKLCRKHLTLSFILRKLVVVTKITCCVVWIAAPIPWMSCLEYPISPSTTLELYIILEKYDILSGVVLINSNILGKLSSVIAAIMPHIYNAGLNIEFLNIEPHALGYA